MPRKTPKKPQPKRSAVKTVADFPATFVFNNGDEFHDPEPSNKHSDEFCRLRVVDGGLWLYGMEGDGIDPLHKRGRTITAAEMVERGLGRLEPTEYAEPEGEQVDPDDETQQDVGGRMKLFGRFILAANTLTNDQIRPLVESAEEMACLAGDFGQAVTV